MALDMFLDLKGIDGESVDKVYAGKIDILAWSWGVSNSGTFHQGGGGGSGKANFQDISITKYVDKASHALLDNCATGKHIPTAKLVVRKAGQKPLEYIIIELDQVLVTSISTGGSGGEDRLTENITLNFAKVTFSYVPQKQDGTGDKKLPFTYDIAKNSK